MSFVINDRGPHKLINLNGELAFHNLIPFKKVLYDLIDEKNESIVVDLKNATFIDSSVIGALITAQKQMKMQKGNFALMHLNEDIYKILQISGLINFFKMYENEDELDSIEK